MINPESQNRAELGGLPQVIPNDYRPQSLAVVVGANPLPAYVAVKLLLPPDGTVYFIHTADVYAVVKRICEQTGLVEGKNAIIAGGEVDDTEPANIRRKVSKLAVGKGEFGLNYTGGTKHMVLHTYQALVNELAKFDARPQLSYLDARTLELRIEEGERVRSFPVGLAVQPTLKELLGLHGYTIKPGERKPILEPVYPHVGAINWHKLKKWCRKAFFKVKLDMQAAIELPCGAGFEALETYGWGRARTLADLASQENASLETVSNWLNDHWLEHYAFWATQQVAQACTIHDCGMNLEPVFAVGAQQPLREFEFDVAAMRGYRLFAITCSTSQNNDSLKLKLFEGFVRARQMGGDEARVGLVCLAPAEGDDSAARLQQELAEEWDAQDKVRVFGAADLPRLPQALKTWYLTGA